NFLSFKDEVTISFEATKDKKLEQYHVVEVAKGIRLLKLGIVYGANASGKTNLLNAFEFLRDFWFNVADSKEDETDVIPFLLDTETPSQLSSFKLSFYVGSTKYVYALEITEQYVLFEKLEYYPGVQPAIVFERKLNGTVSEIVFGSKLKISSLAQEEITIKCLPNMSVFAAYNQVNLQVPELEAASSWMYNQFMPTIEPGTSLVNYSQQLIADDITAKDKILAFLKKADLNISNIETKVITKKISDNFINEVKALNIPKQELERLQKEKSISHIETKFQHEVKNLDGTVSLFPLSINLQSDGTKRVFGLSGALLSTIKQNAFLAIDEIESKLHPDLLSYLLEHFLRESKQAQLLVSTHYDGLLDEDDLLRNDNVWFAEKKKDASTSLYSMAEFKALNRIASKQKAYRVGKFGAIPNIN
ncbi:MAG TPA: ATP-binding protein, partial [Prolixibacteraceae bacterium]|nr:ATP-binding protein [Prolixibacteraceae bacterium]